MVESNRSARNRASRLTPLLASVSLLSWAGCGGGTSAPPSQSASNQSGKTASSPGMPPTAAIGENSQAAALNGSKADSASKSPVAAAAPAQPVDTPEQLLAQMIDLRAERLSDSQTAQGRSALLRERDQKLVDMAHDVIKKTYKDKAKEALFNAAVHFLVESRLQLAAAGSRDDSQALLEDAKALFDRDPNSNAAGEAGFAVARLAATNSRLKKNEPGFTQEFAVQARLFATRFPKFESGAVQPQLLAAAGRACEQSHLDAEAIGCYALLQENYPKSPQAALAACVLTRLELKGKPLQFGGETRDGGFLRMKQFRGNPLLIVFWSSESDSFQEMLPQLNARIASLNPSGLAVVGVCIDETDETLDAFVKKNRLPWPQIFYADPAKRHWDLPVVKYYGVHEVPALWLVDADGVVIDTHVTPESLVGQLKALMASSGRNKPE